ncbi:MAG: sigma-70 family RNA polymerase sigma factor [Pseudomonadota bacterium]
MPTIQSILDIGVTQASTHERVTDLARLHGPMVFATAYRILGNPQQAEDVQQEVYLKLLKRRSQKFWDEVDNWPALLRVMTQNHALDVLRRERRRTHESVELTTTESPDVDVLRVQRAQQLRRALARLSQKDALVFGLRHFEQMSYKEIAKQLGVTQNKIGVVLHRVHNKLRNWLTPEKGDRHD